MVLSIGAPGSNAVKDSRSPQLRNLPASPYGGVRQSRPCGGRACKEPFCGQQGTPGRQRRPQCGPRPSGLQPGPVRPLTASCWIRRSLAVSSRYGRPLRGSPLGLGALFRGAIVSMLYRSASRCTYPTGMQRGRPRMRAAPVSFRCQQKAIRLPTKVHKKLRPGTAPGPAGRCPGAGRCQ